MNPTELPNLSDYQLLDVRLADDFQAAHLEGAKNNCVFEVTFGDRLAETAPFAEMTTVVYGAHDKSHEANAAAEKLHRLGYTDVRILEGGIEGAQTSGLPIVEGTQLPALPSAPDGRLEIDVEASSVEWLGRNLVNKHWGKAPIESGYLNFKTGELTGGEIVIDLLGLTSDDLAGSDLHDVLIAHLHNDDFFDVTNHPKAILTITQATPLEDRSSGEPNLKVLADLTLRGQTYPIEFVAAAGLTPEGAAAAQAAFAIDRTRWGVLYGSGKFFKRLAGHLVNDLIEFQIKIVTR
ncbi:MAG: YceI family protein [Verrucomicrobiota bacterium]